MRVTISMESDNGITAIIKVGTYSTVLLAKDTDGQILVDSEPFKSETCAKNALLKLSDKWTETNRVKSR